jgi:hypothetical protein
LSENPIASHFATADESRYNQRRYRAVAMVSCRGSLRTDLSSRFLAIIRAANLVEFKWHKLRQARDRFAALAMIDETISLAMSGKIRIDALIWDTHDSRHRIKRRDDIANLQRMYYHLFKNVLRNRWPTDATWELCPDEHTGMNWQSVADYLDLSAISLWSDRPDMFSNDDQFHVRIVREFRVVRIQEIASHVESLCQLADLFAGLAAYSHSEYARYRDWLELSGSQLTLAFSTGPHLHFSGSERERFQLLRDFENNCKARKLGVGLHTSHGLVTYKPENPINFWFYEPQTESDTAPTKLHSSSA